MTAWSKKTIAAALAAACVSVGFAGDAHAAQLSKVAEQDKLYGIEARLYKELGNASCPVLLQRGYTNPAESKRAAQDRKKNIIAKETQRRNKDKAAGKPYHSTWYINELSNVYYKYYLDWDNSARICKDIPAGLGNFQGAGSSSGLSS
ncbi:hypothetical protein [Corynebacterium aquilae]|uniref:Uncharacterized protein n=1 Tax=Corynebacterium aquilae DSM 44791 TaxID=1431546 RepID=A0A1L7CFT5_9CORY|nr:hypothetical protein [Corynebacterium aquilae]APT84684.1 hypothetical protein CAQU_05930 [Corynebacterium aquilae DSM 44791]